jgi:hypothetical protein
VFADDDTASNEPAVEPAEEVAPLRPVGSGTTEIAVFVDNVCGGLYDVFLRVIAFNNFQVTSDQLLTKGGNPFQSATGWANSNVAMATMTQADFCEVWFFVWNLGDLLAIYNVCGISADFTPPESADDLAQYESVDSPEALASAIGASADSCAAEVQVDEAVTTPFPSPIADA